MKRLTVFDMQWHENENEHEKELAQLANQGSSASIGRLMNRGPIYKQITRLEPVTENLKSQKFLTLFHHFHFTTDDTWKNRSYR